MMQQLIKPGISCYVIKCNAITRSVIIYVLAHMKGNVMVADILKISVKIESLPTLPLM